MVMRAKREFQRPKHPHYTVEEFYKHNGLLQPIRAIVYQDVQFFEKKFVDDAAYINKTLGLLKNANVVDLEPAKAWKKCINRSNVVGYFAAWMDDPGAEACNPDEINDYRIMITYSFCRPMDWPYFDPHLSKVLAINKDNVCGHIDIDRESKSCSIFRGNVIVTDELDKCEKKIITDKSVKTNFSTNVFFEKIPADNVFKQTAVVYIPLGSLSDQFNYFAERIMKYHKIGRFRFA